MVTRRRAECNTPEKRVLFLGGVFSIRGLMCSVLCESIRVAPCGWSIREAKRDGRLVGLQFLFWTAAEVVPVEGTPKVVAVL